MLYSDFYL